MAGWQDGRLDVWPCGACCLGRTEGHQGPHSEREPGPRSGEHGGEQCGVTSVSGAGAGAPMERAAPARPPQTRCRPLGRARSILRPRSGDKRPRLPHTRSEAEVGAVRAGWRMGDGEGEAARVEERQMKRKQKDKGRVREDEER